MLSITQLPCEMVMGQNDLRTMLPSSRVEPCQQQLRKAKRLPDQDLAMGYGTVEMPWTQGH